MCITCCTLGAVCRINWCCAVLCCGHAMQSGYRTDMSVEAWLDSLGLGSLAEAFFAAGYQDFLVIQVCVAFLQGSGS